jgi:putative ABC transport system permease protein
VFSVPYLTLIIIVLLAGLAGVVAAILPSRRAAKLNVLRAIVTE